MLIVIFVFYTKLESFWHVHKCFFHSATDFKSNNKSALHSTHKELKPPMCSIF